MAKLTFTHIGCGIYMSRGSGPYGAFRVTRSPFKADAHEPWRLRFRVSTLGLIDGGEREERFKTLNEAKARARALAAGKPV